MAILLAPTGGRLGDRGPCEAVWGRIPAEVRANLAPGRGFCVFDDFIKPIYTTTTGTYLPGWYYEEYTDGSVGLGAAEGGILAIGTGSATYTNQGAQIRTDAAFVADTDTMLAFGFRYKMVDADKQNVVLGLAVADSDYPGNIASTTADAIVIRHTGDATIFYQQNTSAGGMTAATTTADDVADDTWVTVDVLVTKETGTQIYVNGTLEKTDNTNSLPTDTALCLVLANESTEGTDNILSVDWAYAASWRVDV